MATVYALDGASALSAIVSAVLALPRAAAEEIAHAAITRLDELEPDSDLEETDTEDAFAFSRSALNYMAQNGPGCSIGDPDCAVDDEGCDDIHDDREEEDDITPDWGLDQTEPLPEKVVVNADLAQVRKHRERIQRTRCVPRYYRGSRHIRDHTLLCEPRVPTRRQLLKRKRGVPRRPRP